MTIFKHDRVDTRKGAESSNSSGTTIRRKDSFTILLTGSTGNLGSYLLDELTRLPQLAKVVCLNRSDDAFSRQKKALQDRGLSATHISRQTEFIQVDLAQESFGLDQATYASLVQEADLMIHNAWPVDFNRNFNSFGPSITGVKNIISFCKASAAHRTPCKLLFISSIAATSSWGSAAPTSRAKIPEAELMDWKVARTGYGQSKLLCERMLTYAAKALSLPVSVVRVGQLAGPVTHGVQGRWPEQEWVPSLIRSSIYLGALPDTLGPVSSVDWVPVDLAARAIAEITYYTLGNAPVETSRPLKGTTKTRFYHVVNPRIVDWSTLVPAIRQNMPNHVRTVPIGEWIGLLKESAGEAGRFSGVEEGSNPAAKLMDFFENLQDRAIRFPTSFAPQLETNDTATVSHIISEMPAVSREWVDLWMRQWDWKD